MTAAVKPADAKPEGFVDAEPSAEVVNDSLGTVNVADTTNTDPEDDPETRGKGIGKKGNEA